MNHYTAEARIYMCLCFLAVMVSFFLQYIEDRNEKRELYSNVELLNDSLLFMNENYLEKVYFVEIKGHEIEANASFRWVKIDPTRSEIFKLSNNLISYFDMLVLFDSLSTDDLDISTVGYGSYASYIPIETPLEHTSISSQFGDRFHPIYRKRLFHDGIDLRSFKGTPIKCPANGTVKFTGYVRGYGNFVIVNHGNGFETRYGHLDEILVEENEQIAKNQVIGRVGNTGTSTSSHLHYEVLYNGKPIDPNGFFMISSI